MKVRVRRQYLTDFAGARMINILPESEGLRGALPDGVGFRVGLWVCFSKSGSFFKVRV